MSKKVYFQKKDHYSSHMVISRIIKSNNSKKLKILDLGCDVGFLGHSLKQMKVEYEIHGVDLNRENLKKASKHYLKTYHFDLNQLQWRIKDKYEIVVLADTIEHLHNPKRVLLNIHKRLKPKGKVIISVPNAVFWWSRLRILLGQFPKEDRGLFDRTHLHFFTFKTLGNIITDSKRFTIKTVHTTTFPLQFVIGDLYNNPIFKAMYTANYLLSLINPNIFSYQVIIVAEKI